MIERSLQPWAILTTVLGQDDRLRERVYQSLYQYCHTLKYGLGQPASVEALVYLTLYQDFHLSELAATQLTYFIRRYTQLARPSPYAASPTDVAMADKRPMGQVPGPFNGQPASQAATSTPSTTTGPPLVGWQLLTMPDVERLDESSGSVSFRIKMSARREVESVARVAGNASPEQGRAYRTSLTHVHFTNADPTAAAAVGTYTFRYSVH